MKLVSAGQLCNGCPARVTTYILARRARFGSSRPWPVAVPGCPWACRVRGVSVVNVLSLGSSSGVVWGRVPITAPAGAATGVTSRADAHSQMRRYAQTGPTAKLSSAPMTTMWGAPLHRRWRGSRLRDPRQAKFLTLASLKWVLANRAYTPWYLVRYWRLLRFKLANPHIITRGMVFLGKGVEIHATPELAQLEIGRWVHIGDKNTIRAHEGSLRFGDKVVLGRDNVINTYLDIEIGDSVLMADWCYICDFDHRMDDITLPIKDQGIIKSPVRIGHHHAAAGIEYQQLPQVCTHEQAAMPQKPRGGRHPDHGLAPARPLGRRKGDYRSRLADVEVVEAVEQRAGEAAALDQPHTPALPAVVVVLPLHQRTPGRGLPV